MKFALVNGQREEARPGQSGECQGCGASLLAKCGEVRVWHWAHRTKRVCDAWWENEGEWHRAWKSQFPESWQEIVHSSEGGEKHIADVKTNHGWVIEFQHSHIRPEERRSRNAFYGKLVWVVNGARLKRAKTQFMETWDYGATVSSIEGVRKVFLNECALLREWSGSQTPIFLDFGDEQTLWWLVAGSDDGGVYVRPFSRSGFVEALRGGTEQNPIDFGSFVARTINDLAAYESNQRFIAARRAELEQQHAMQRLMAWGRRGRRL